jgi:hypothetical protein
MSDTPDFRGQAERNKPTDFLHGLMNKIPGYTGYADRERRRDADKMLRTYLARQYRDQLGRLARVQTAAVHTRHQTILPELQRLEGMLNRFVDKLDTASYGYAGLFDANKVTEAELDQLYTFDQGLASGVQNVSKDLDALEAATRQGTGDTPATTSAEVPPLAAAMTQLGTTIDNLLQTWNHRNDVLTTGTPLPSQEFERFRTNMDAQGTPTGRLDPHQAPPPLAGNAGTAGSASSSGAGLGNAGPGPGPGMSGSMDRPDPTQPDGDSGATQRLNPPPASLDPPPPRASMPGGAEGGSIGAGDMGTSRPMVGGGESAGSPASRAGADPYAVTSYDDPNAPAVGPEADDGSHSTIGGQPGPGGGSGSGQ